MSKFDMLSGDEAIRIEITGSKGSLITILDEEIKQGSSGDRVQIDVDGDVYFISDIAHTEYSPNKWVTVMWAESHNSGFCVGTLRDQFTDINDRSSPVVIVTKDEKRGKYGEAAGYRMLGCTIDAMEVGHKSLLISAKVKCKFTGIKTFMKQLGHI